MDAGDGSNQKKRGRQEIPLSVVKRLPVYYRFLTDLARKEVERVSSRELAAKIGINSSQLRQDLNLFGSFGQQGYGYRVLDLLHEVEQILGIGQDTPMVLIGAGNIGRAIINYDNFKRRGFRITAIFDRNPKLFGELVDGIPIRDITELEEHLHEHAVRMGILTIPSASAQEIADILVTHGVKGIWNFAPVSLKVPPDVAVENVHISESLMILSFRVRQGSEEKE